ncbi:MAG: alpha/beta fold hydrolase [Cyanobacteria bacterium J06598_3]
MEFYTWQSYRCAFEKVPGKASAQLASAQSTSTQSAGTQSAPALLMVHPIGVGLSGEFWRPFIIRWQATNQPVGAVYNVDLLGCGESDMPARAYTPEDWAQQLAYFIEHIAQEPVVLVVQGALLPVAVRLMETDAAKDIKGMVLSGPPAWRLMTTPTETWKQKLAWALFSSPLGNGFYRYARREKFLASFSQRQLFEKPEDVTDSWLAMLNAGSRNMNSRYAVFSFLAGFWRQDYAAAIARIQQPVMIVMGNAASTIDRKTAQEVAKTVAKAGGQVTTAQPNPDSPAPAVQKRLRDYLDHFPRAQGVSIPGRNVMPYETTDDFVRAIAPFIASL